MRLRLAPVVAMMLLGCSASHPLADACHGARPTLDSCTNGLVHSECGGDEEGVLACDEITGQCRWFVGGCVAAGFRVIDCPSEDVCCITTADGEWPFEEGWLPSGPGSDRELVEDIAFAGPAPISRSSPDNVAVTIDPTLSIGEPSVECDGLDLDLCAGWNPSPGTAARPHDTVLLVFRPDLFGDELYVEVVEQDDGTLVGRTFSRYLHDYHEEAPRSCDAARTRQVRLSGTLVVDRLAEYPMESHGVLDLADPAGGTLRISF